MLRRVPAFDLVGTCISCGTTVAELSEETGIPERELLLFSMGQIAFSPRDWLAIMDRMPSVVEPVSSPGIPRKELLRACRQLVRDAETQDRLENPK